MAGTDGGQDQTGVRSGGANRRLSRPRRRLWPRGVSKADAAIDEWLKEIAPSDTLRRWFGHDPNRFEEFRARHEQELAVEPAPELLSMLAKRAVKKTVTLVYAAHDEEHNNAVVLAALLGRPRVSGPRHG